MFWKRTRPEKAKYRREIEVLVTDDGWREWDACYYAPYGCLIEITRYEWNQSQVLYRGDMPYEMNTVGLYWRLTGIGKEQLANRPPSRGQSQNRYATQQGLCGMGLMSGMLGGLLGNAGQPASLFPEESS